MAVFFNSTAEDVSARFACRESSFDECARVGRNAAEQSQKLLLYIRNYRLDKMQEAGASS